MRNLSSFANVTLALVLGVAFWIVADNPAQGQENLHNRWLARPVLLTPHNQSLSDFLASFCAAQNVAGKIEDNLSGTVSGNFRTANPAGLLDAVAQSFPFVWYFDGKMVYFYSPASLDSAILRLTPQQMLSLESALVSMKLFDSRYAWDTSHDNDMVYVTAPPRYLEIIRDVAARIAPPDDHGPGLALRFFRLNYAWAEDRRVNIRDETIVVPGVASLLSNLTRGGGPDGPATPAPTNIFINADSRLNAVVVRDHPSQMPMYEEMIRELDRPVELVEIRAAIFDIATDKTRELGFSWQASRDKGRGMDFSGGIGQGTKPEFGSPLGDGINFTAIYTHGFENLMVKISAMESEQHANMLSRPQAQLPTRRLY